MIPDGWKAGLMGEVIKLISGQHIEAQFYNEDKIGIPYLTGPSDFQDGKINITKYTEQPKVLCESGDILITVKGSGTGKSIVANQKCCIGRQLMAIRAIEIDRTFAFYIIQSREAKYGDTASGLIPGIAREHILETSLLIPPLLEQCRIAEVLGVWDESIALLERLIGKMRSRKQGLIQQLLTGKKRFKEFEGSEWKSYSFSEIVKLRSKKFDPKTSSESKICVELEHISQISGELLGTIDSSKQASTKNYFFTGDVLFGKLRPYLRKYLLAQFDGVCSTEIWVLVSQKYITPNYLFYLVQTSEFIATANVSSGSKMPRADWGYISEVSFRLPSLPEQEKIAAVLSAADEEISTLEKQLAAYKQQKLGLMQQLLTGRIRI
jgi:type I restriction enzyme, S subunit